MSIYNSYLTGDERQFAIETAIIGNEINKLNILYEMKCLQYEQMRRDAEVKIFAEGGTYDDLTSLYLEVEAQAVPQKKGILQSIFEAISRFFEKVSQVFSSTKAQYAAVPDNTPMKWNAKIGQTIDGLYDPVMEADGALTEFVNNPRKGIYGKFKSIFSNKICAVLGIVGTGATVTAIIAHLTGSKDENASIEANDNSTAGVVKSTNSKLADMVEKIKTWPKKILDAISKMPDSVKNKLQNVTNTLNDKTNKAKEKAAQNNNGGQDGQAKDQNAGAQPTKASADDIINGDTFMEADPPAGGQAPLPTGYTQGANGIVLPNNVANNNVANNNATTNNTTTATPANNGGTDNNQSGDQNANADGEFTDEDANQMKDDASVLKTVVEFFKSVGSFISTSFSSILSGIKNGIKNSETIQKAVDWLTDRTKIDPEKMEPLPNVRARIKKAGLLSKLRTKLGGTDIIVTLWFYKNDGPLVGIQYNDETFLNIDDIDILDDNAKKEIERRNEIARVTANNTVWANNGQGGEGDQNGGQAEGQNSGTQTNGESADDILNDTAYLESGLDYDRISSIFGIPISEAVNIKRENTLTSDTLYLADLFDAI